MILPRRLHALYQGPIRLPLCTCTCDTNEHIKSYLKHILHLELKIKELERHIRQLETDKKPSEIKLKQYIP